MNDATLKALAIDPTSPSISVGQDLRLSASGDFSNNTSQDLTRDVVWGSGNADIATVSNSLGVEGTVRGIGAGNVTITADSDTIPTITGIPIFADVVVTVQ